MATSDQRPLALVTGGSRGIGLELVRQFAEHGYDVVMAAEDGDLESAAAQLGDTDVELDTVRVDLTTPAGVDELYEHIRRAGRPLELAALNAGIGDGGGFAEGTSLQKDLELVDLNVRSVVHLSKYVVRDMVEQGHGRILFTSSIAATMPGPFHAVYNASKSFVQSFALALRSELKDTNVTVTSLMPGPTDTDFFGRADLEDTILGSVPRDDPAELARQAFEALVSGRERVIASSTISKVQGRTSRLLPDSAKAATHRLIARPGSARLLEPLARMVGRGSATTARSLPIRAAAEDVERHWRDQREAVLAGIPASSAELRRGAEQGEWGTTWTLSVRFTPVIPSRLREPLAGKAIRRLKALSETGELPTTEANPSFRVTAREGAER